MAVDQAQEIEALRTDTREWLRENWDPDRNKREWIEMVIDRGDAVPTWPAEWHGRGVSTDAARAITVAFHLGLVAERDKRGFAYVRAVRGGAATSE